MRLNYLELYGFKSFADKSKLTFEKNISAIVGPNGSGKSNISDAIRWVLGEQSVKSLRGTRMEDVIFAGTDEKKPMNMAQVTISFDNKSGLIPLAFDQVNVTRRVYRSGESEYLINNSQVRLRDIKEIFLDTGIGKDGYSIIGQGRIDDILSSRNEDRRYIFEEACGISKYKYKKTDSERKLLKNEEHLKEIRAELKIKTQEVEILEKQAQNAREGIRLTRLLEEKELVLLKFNMDKSKREIDKLSQAIEDLQGQYDFSKKEYEKYFNKINPIEDQLAGLEKDLEEARESFNRLERALQKNDGDRKLLEEKNNFHKLDIDRIEKTNENRNDKFIENLKKLDENKKKLGDLKRSIEDRKLDLSRGKKAQDKLLLASQDQAKKIASYQARQKVLIDRLNQLKMDKHTHLEMEKSNEKVKEDSIRELNQLRYKIREGQKDLEDLRLKEKDLEKDLEDILSGLANEETRSKDLEETMERIYMDLNEGKNKLYKLQSKEGLLYSIYKSYDGYYKPVQRLLTDADKNPQIKEKIVGVLADLIEVSPSYQLAIDVSLGSALQNIVVKDEEDAKFLIDYIKKKNYGRITFLPISKIGSRRQERPEDPLIIDLASNLISYDPRIEKIIYHYLARTIIVKDLASAIDLSKRVRNYRLVTLDGEIINSWGSMVGGNLYKKETNSLINRKKEIKDLRKTIEGLKTDLKSQEENYLMVKEDFKKSEALILEKNQARKKLKEEFFKLKDQDKEAILELNYLEKRQDQLDSQIKSLNNDHVINEEEIGNLESVLKKVDRDIERLTDEKTKTSQEEREKEREIIQLENKLEILRRDWEIVENKVEDLSIENEDIKASEKREGQILEELRQELRTNKSKIEDLEKAKLDQERRLEKTSLDIESLEEKIAGVEEETKKDRAYMDKLSQDLLDLEKKLYQKELRRTNEAERSQEALEAFLIDYSMEKDYLEERLEKLKPGQVERKEINDIKGQLAKIGFFNPEKIDQYEKDQKELAFLESQYDDLVKTREDILSMIRRLEAEMRLAFNESFGLINEKFQEIFAILFDGGQAELILDSDDVLNAGIEIVAKPPGKKLKSIGLLSGGEKSLTAVALLFAIFEINPAPFCVLDEIDAALDEANINKYINYLKSMTDKTQFVIITHRKTTMEMAEILYGVTMEDKGVSKVITLAFDDYKEE